MPLSDAQRQLASLPLAVVLLAPGQVIASANPAAEQLFGQSQRRLLGRSLLELMRFSEPRLTKRVTDADAQLSAHATSVTVAGQGTARRLDVMLAPVIDQPGWQVLTLSDIGGIEALGDDAAHGDETMLRAPAILAHEIKNPLAGIRGAAQLLGRKLGPADRALTTLIADEVDRIAKLIDQMQSLSRRSAEPVAPCNLHEAVRRARSVIDAAGDAPNITEEFDPSLPLVLGNADSLVQVLLNLLANARDACTGRPGAKLAVRTRFASGLQLHTNAAGEPVRLPIELRVSDNGPGIDPEMRDHIFEPFVTTKKSGQGLGLALVRRLVRDMNGRISHDRDEVGGWTHFRVHLPVAKAQRQAKDRAA
jgi:two-component system nitrogen regulation sensor histidine kinase GlnL